MVHIRFTSLVLGLLFVMHALRDYSSAHAHQGWETNGNGFAVSGENVVSVQKKEPLVGMPSAAATRKLGLGGRKMLVDKESRKEIEKGERLNRGSTSLISGKDNINASKKSFGRSQNQLDDQKKTNMLESKSLKSSSLRISKSKPVHLPHIPSHSSSQDSKSVSSTHNTAQKDEAQRLLEAAKEIVNLMHKDYKGTSRTPPINNREPSD